MIKELRIVDPALTPIEWWGEIEALKDRGSIEFMHKGLNVIIGPNGVGKSSILKALATLTHCFQGGIPKVTQTSIGPFSKANYSYGTKHRIGMELDQDGQPVHFLDPDITPGLAFGGAAFDYDFLSDLKFTMGMKSLSSGQGGMAKFGRVIESAFASAKETPDATVPVDSNLGRFNDTWQAKLKVAVKSLEATCEKGQRTLLLDEPSRSLDLPNQVEMWQGLLRWSESFQIIVATHSPLAIGVAGAHYIELKEGYLAECEEALKTIRGGSRG